MTVIEAANKWVMARKEAINNGSELRAWSNLADAEWELIKAVEQEKQHGEEGAVDPKAGHV